MARCHRFFLYEEIYFHSALGIRIAATVEVQFMTAAFQHLCDNVLDKHTFVDFKFVEHQLLIDF